MYAEMRKTHLLRPFVCILALAGYACAYIDPGTGGMIVGGVGGAIWPMIVAFFAGVVGFILRFFRPIKDWVSGKKKSQDRPKLS
jgi:fucose permease